MSARPYKPFNPESIGNTVSCHTLARMLNEIGSNSMNKSVAAHISRYFGCAKEIAKSIECPKVRKYVGEMMLRDIKYFNIDILCPPKIVNVIKNVKYCYVKDLFINEVPLNYSRPENANCRPFFWEDDGGGNEDVSLTKSELEFGE